MKNEKIQYDYHDKHQRRDHYFQNACLYIEFVNRFQIKMEFSY